MNASQILSCGQLAFVLVIIAVALWLTSEEIEEEELPEGQTWRD